MRDVTLLLIHKPHKTRLAANVVDVKWLLNSDTERRKAVNWYLKVKADYNAFLPSKVK